MPKDKVIDYITTSGTLGDPVTFCCTEKDLHRLAYNEKKSFECAGVYLGNVVQLMTTIDKRFMAGLAYFLGIRELGAESYVSATACRSFSGTRSSASNRTR